MKTLFRILQIVLSVIGALLAVLFLFIEGWNLLSADWYLHQQPVAGLLSYLFRTILSAGVLVSMIRMLSGKRTILYESLCITAVCTVLAVLVPNGFGILFLTLSVLSLFVNIMLKD